MTSITSILSLCDVPLFRAACAVLLSVLLSGCEITPRYGPIMEDDATAPFLTASGPSPTQGDAQQAVDAAILRDGVGIIFPHFTALAQDRLPVKVTLFACRPGRSPAVLHGRATVTCHVDVLDRSGDLLGRATMAFERDRERWIVVSHREREGDAR